MAAPNTLLLKIGALLRLAELEPKTKLAVIEIASQASDKLLSEIINILEYFIDESKSDAAALEKKLTALKASYEKNNEHALAVTEQSLDKIEGQMSESEEDDRVQEIQQDIKNT